MSIFAAIQIFKGAGVLEDDNSRARFGEDIFSHLRGLDYEQEWELCRKRFWFHGLMKGGGFVRFDENSYRFYMSPYSLMSFEEFVADRFGWGDAEQSEFEVDLRYEYGLYVASEKNLSPVFPLRVDYHEAGYSEGIHPVCHIHFGIQNDRNTSRFPVRRRMSHEDFALFVLRCFYPDEWLIVAGQHLAEDKLERLKSSIPVADDFWKPLDACQYFFD